MTILDIRNMKAETVDRIRFADGGVCIAVYITRNGDGTIVLEDEDMDGGDYRIGAGDVDNFVKARAHARSLGWDI